jgi:hypothetical protein
MRRDEVGPCTAIRGHEWIDVTEKQHAEAHFLCINCTKTMTEPFANPVLTPEEETELVGRINANPNLHPLS